MTLPVSPNKISLLNIATEYPSQSGAVKPYSLSNYYRDENFVPNSTIAPHPNIPLSSTPQIKLSDFYGTSKFFLFNDTLTSDTSNYNVYNKLIAGGWDGMKPVIVNVTVNSGVFLYGSSTSAYAFRVGPGIPYTFPANSRLNLVNNGYIIGKGGNGGAGAAGSTVTTYNSPTEVSLTVPSGITKVSFEVVGGGGGGGGHNESDGGAGQPAKTVVGEITVTPGDILKFSAGQGGGAGKGQVSGGGAGNPGLGYFSGGEGGKAGSTNQSGAGGGGGGASVIRLNDVVKVVAAGGGGGGGAGKFTGGQPPQNISASPSNDGTDGQDKGDGDGGGGGGGGAGYPGGAGGLKVGGDEGAYGGTSGASYKGAGVTISGTLNDTVPGTGGRGGIRQVQSSSAGINGYIKISYIANNGTGSSGSNGGSAMYIDSAITIQNNGIIAGGGGGGGGGGGHPDSNAGAGGGGGGGLNASGPKGWYAASSTAWWSWMNNYAIWKGGVEEVTTNSFSQQVYFPTTGNYTFYLSTDNTGSLSIDGVQILTGPGFKSYSTVTRSVTAGYHTIAGVITNTPTSGTYNPAGIAAQIIKPDNVTELWNTRNLISTSATVWGGVGGNGGVGPGPDGSDGSDGSYIAGNGGNGGDTIVGLGGNGGALGQSGQTGVAGIKNGITGYAGGAGGAAGKAVAYGNNLATWSGTGVFYGSRL